MDHESLALRSVSGSMLYQFVTNQHTPRSYPRGWGCRFIYLLVLVRDRARGGGWMLDPLFPSCLKSYQKWSDLLRHRCLKWPLISPLTLSFGKRQMPWIFLLKQCTLTHVLLLAPNFYRSRHKIGCVRSCNLFVRACDHVEQVIVLIFHSWKSAWVRVLPLVRALFLQFLYSQH